MINKISFKIGSLALILFVFLQLVIAFFYNSSYFNVYGLFHFGIIGSFLFFYSMSQRSSVRQIFFLILIYQTTLVLGHFLFYVINYENSLGYQPTDEIFYNRIGIELQNQNFESSLDYLSKYVGISDFGFPLAVKYIYALGGNEIFNMKIFNIFCHLLTCLFLFRTAEILLENKLVSKTVLIFYGLNPISIYFNSSGRKEPLFILIVVICFYLVYKAIKEKKLKFYIFALISIMATGLFRTIFPVFIVLAFGFLYFINVHGKYKFFLRLVYSIIGLIVLGLAVLVVQEELTGAIAVDQNALAAARIGRTPSVLDYTIMTISGIIGPFPSFVYLKGNDSALLQTAGNFIKIFLSFFFLVGLYKIIKERRTIFYPILLFISFNVIMVVSVAAALDHRFLYPFIPLYFIVIAFGVNEYAWKQKFLSFSVYLISISSLIIAYNLR